MTFSVLNRIIKEHKHVTYKNYMNDTTFLKNDFYNADHLNKDGAKKLSLKLNSLINKIVIN